MIMAYSVCGSAEVRIYFEKTLNSYLWRFRKLRYQPQKDPFFASAFQKYK